MDKPQETRCVPQEIERQLELLKWIRYATKEIQNLPNGKLTDSLKANLNNLLNATTFIVIASSKLDELARIADEINNLTWNVRDDLGNLRHPQHALSERLKTFIGSLGSPCPPDKELDM